METLTFLAIYIAGIAIFIFVSLFGDSSTFRGTPVQKLHWLFTQGACQGLRYITHQFCTKLTTGRNQTSLRTHTGGWVTEYAAEES